MPYKKEIEMYQHVITWLENFLVGKYRKHKIKVFDTSRKSLTKLIQEQGLMQNLPNEWHSWEIFVDVTGFAITETETIIAFAECKLGFTTLDHLSQLLGYSRVVKPAHSFLLSPGGPSDNLQSLLTTFGRTDVLEYDSQKGEFGKSIVVARWDDASYHIDHNKLITKDGNSLGQL